MDDHDIHAAIKLMPTNTILMAHAGSHAFKLDTPTSDRDFSGIFVIPLHQLLDPTQHQPETRETKKAAGAFADATFHDIGKFIRLGLAGNPTILESLWAPTTYIHDLGIQLQAARRHFLHRGTLKPYFGYYTAQRRRAETGKPLHTTGGQWNPKFACHMLRLLYAAEYLANYHEILVDTSKLPTQDYHTLKDAKAGRLAQPETLKLADTLLARAQAAEARSTLPEAPNTPAIAKLAIHIRTNTV